MHCSEFYDLMMEDDLKIEAIFTYDDPRKDVIKGNILYVYTPYGLIVTVTISPHCNDKSTPLTISP